jgi:DNA anti-recombination protein RmuC
LWVKKAKEIEKSKATIAKELEELKLENAKLSDSLEKIEKRLSDAAKPNTTEMPEATINKED